MPSLEILLLIFIAIAALLTAISVHESAHAWMANRLGDPTAKHLGRISLNPADHIDPIGTIFLPIVMLLIRGPLIGWAKPTPFNPWNLRNPKRDSALIALAGPASNFILAILVALPIRFGLIPFLNPFNLSDPSLFFSASPIEKISLLLSGFLYLNLILGFFNLIPIHPLDGFKVVGGLLPKNLYYQWISLERYGTLILLALIFFGGSVIGLIIGPLLELTLRILVGG